jgi:predicted N-acyltransferase
MCSPVTNYTADYKWARGFDPALIHSVHYICNKSLQRAIRQFLDYETESNVELTDYLLLRSVVGNRGKRPASA